MKPDCDAVPFASPELSDHWLTKIRSDHPRLFFNQDSWPSVRARALGPSREYYEKIKERVDGYPDEPTGISGGPAFEREETIGGRIFKLPGAEPATEWGDQAMETAFVYLMTGDRQYLDRARRMLEVSIEVYHQCYRERRVVNWYCLSRVCALAAYDWIFNDLTPDQREEILLPLLLHIEDVQPDPGKPQIYGINDSDHKTGFYGVRNLVWYAGLTAAGDGIDDERALEFLRLGYKYNHDVLNFRKMCAQDDGGQASATTGYALGAYSQADFNLFHTWKSATGEELAPLWPHVAYFPIWIMWNWIPAKDSPKEFGSGDTYHGDNNLRTYALYDHMSQMMHFYGRSQPECAALAAHIREIVPEKNLAAYLAINPFLLTDFDSAPPPKSPSESRLFARHFEGLGQVVMRSGTGPEDTYCLYTIGSMAPNHQHYDENHFIIYRKGFLALDSGTRGNSKDFNLRYYYAQTVAHNCMLIRMPGEPMPRYWGPEYEGPEGKTNDGGMHQQIGGKVAAFETNKHYTYVAGDATPCYSNEKCKLALRQFVYVMPDHFVIFDRVISTEAEFAKAWLLHTQNEPAVDGDTFQADEGEGRLYCRTLLPRDAALTKIGGQGKAFWSNGKNWELNDSMKEQQENFKATTGKAMLLGNWRIEVSPCAPAIDDTFLHLIEVGDQTLHEMTPSKLVEEEDRKGVRFETHGKTVTVLFGTSGQPSGHITIESEGAKLLDGSLTEEVMPQAVLAEPRVEP